LQVVQLLLLLQQLLLPCGHTCLAAAARW
jgi:hypothetical protein